MTTLQSLARARTDLDRAEVEWLTGLVADWSILADLGFSDLVLYLPTWNAGGWVAAGQVRPDTVPTRIPSDMVGRFVPKGRLPQVDRALAAGEIVSSRSPSNSHVPTDREAIPVRMPTGRGGIAGRHIAVIARYAGLHDRPLGQLEDAYLQAADDLAAMVSEGSFPTPGVARSASARVGDGLMRVDAQGVVVFASPNAQSAMRVLGVSTPALGADLARLVGRVARRPGGMDSELTQVAAGRINGSVEVDSDSGTLSLRSIRLVRPDQRGDALILVRDVSEVRRQERALVSKDATIREIHHRVKNNLQTVAALLRLQARRMPTAEAADALQDAVGRVSAIAVVHETMSVAGGDIVDFDAVADRLVLMARDTATAHRRGREAPRVGRQGRFGDLPADVATPLAMCVSELLSNAAEHSAAGRIDLIAEREPGELTVLVADDGRGMPERLRRADGGGGLGLQIVATLVTGELRGHLGWDDVPRGTVARLTCPLAEPVPR